MTHADTQFLYETSVIYQQDRKCTYYVNIVARSRNHCSNVIATMCYQCNVELHVTDNNIEILTVTHNCPER